MTISRGLSRAGQRGEPAFGLDNGDQRPLADLHSPKAAGSQFFVELGAADWNSGRNSGMGKREFLGCAIAVLASKASESSVLGLASSASIIKNAGGRNHEMANY